MELTLGPALSLQRSGALDLAPIQVKTTDTVAVQRPDAGKEQASNAQDLPKKIGHALPLAGGRSPVIGVCGQLGGRNFYTKKKMRIRLRRIVAELTPDKQILQDVMRKYSGGSQTKLSAVTFIQQVLA